MCSIFDFHVKTTSFELDLLQREWFPQGTNLGTINAKATVGIIPIPIPLRGVF